MQKGEKKKHVYLYHFGSIEALQFMCINRSSVQLKATCILFQHSIIMYTRVTNIAVLYNTPQS